jgi:hypothetical protein
MCLPEIATPGGPDRAAEIWVNRQVGKYFSPFLLKNQQISYLFLLAGVGA